MPIPVAAYAKKKPLKGEQRTAYQKLEHTVAGGQCASGAIIQAVGIITDTECVESKFATSGSLVLNPF